MVLLEQQAPTINVVKAKTPIQTFLKDFFMLNQFYFAKINKKMGFINKFMNI